MDSTSTSGSSLMFSVSDLGSSLRWGASSLRRLDLSQRVSSWMFFSHHCASSSSMNPAFVFLHDSRGLLLRSASVDWYYWSSSCHLLWLFHTVRLIGFKIRVVFGCLRHRSHPNREKGKWKLSTANVRALIFMFEFECTSLQPWRIHGAFECGWNQISITSAEPIRSILFSLVNGKRVRKRMPDSMSSVAFKMISSFWSASASTLPSGPIIMEVPP